MLYMTTGQMTLPLEICMGDSFQSWRLIQLYFSSISQQAVLHLLVQIEQAFRQTVPSAGGIHSHKPLHFQGLLRIYVLLAKDHGT